MHLVQVVRRASTGYEDLPCLLSQHAYTKTCTMPTLGGDLRSYSGGFPVTDLREITILKKLKHENIVDLREVTVDATYGIWLSSLRVMGEGLYRGGYDGVLTTHLDVGHLGQEWRCLTLTPAVPSMHAYVRASYSCSMQ